MDMMNNVKKGRNKLFYKILRLFIIASLAIFGIIAITFIYLYSTTKLNKDLLNKISTPALVYANDNSQLTDNVQGVPYVKIENLQQHTIDAFISIEDKKFYSHNGINIKRMFSAMINNITSLSLEEGASTITQQLIKNTHLSSDKTFERKIKEIMLALKIEKEYSKNEILEMYLNAIYFGNGCYGIESASKFYFGKSATEIDINESALLAGLIKSPAYYSPLKHEENAIQRKNLVIKEMYEDKAISLEEFDILKTTNLSFDMQSLDFDRESSYINSVLDEASKILAISPTQIIAKKYKIFTYYDCDIWQDLANAVKHDTNAMHNAIVVDNETGGILAFNSSYTFGANNIQRTPASTIKPILVYGAGIEYGNIFPCSILEDKPTTYGDNYTPKNLGNKYYGNISADLALAKSLNIPAINLLKDIGIEKCKSFAKKCGISFDEDDNGLSLALGAMKHGITIQTLTNGYLCFACEGQYKKSTFIKSIVDENGRVLYTHNINNKKAMQPETAYLVGQMMKKTTTDGTCIALNSLPFEVYAKSGTNGTNNEKLNSDSICIAQTTKHTACMWYFSKDYKEENLLENASVSQLSPTIKMKELFNSIYENEKPSDFKKPNGVIKLKLDSISYEDGNVEIASIETPERYILESNFNRKFTPKTISKNFTKCISTVLECNFQKKQNIVSYNAVKHQTYELIREHFDDNKKIVQTLQVVKEKSGKISFTDTSPPDVPYKYYLKITNNKIKDIAFSNEISSINEYNENNLY